MESQLVDLRDGNTLSIIKNLREIIIDCARNIKSNDSTFNISTLPGISDNLSEFMTAYIDTMQRIESCQNAFRRLLQDIDDDDEVQDNQETIDLTGLTDKFKETVDSEMQEIATEEISAHVELERIIRPHIDEDIQVETPNIRIPKDPITKKDIMVAVRSTICNHIYDKDGIEEYFLQKEAANKTRIQCPQAGCTNKKMTRSELVLDEETNKLIKSL